MTWSPLLEQGSVKFYTLVFSSCLFLPFLLSLSLSVCMALNTLALFFSLYLHSLGYRCRVGVFVFASSSGVLYTPFLFLQPHLR